jgi:hypothetical protein
VNNFSMHWKLVFVAAVVLILVAVVPQFSAPALAQPARGATSNVAAAAGIFADRATRPASADQDRRLSPGAIIGLICAIAASSVALGVAFGLRRRIDRIAGPDPDKADDD